MTQDDIAMDEFLDSYFTITVQTQVPQPLFEQIDETFSEAQGTMDNVATRVIRFGSYEDHVDADTWERQQMGPPVKVARHKPLTNG